MRGNFGSPEYERLQIDDDDDGWSDGEETTKRSLRPRNLDDSLEYQRNREDWQRDQSRARLSRYSHNRRASSESARQRSIRDVIKGKDSGINEDFFQSCASLKSKHDSSDEIRSPIKSVTRNFLESHFEPVNRLSDIYVAPAKRDFFVAVAPQNHDSQRVLCILTGIILTLLFLAYHNFLK